MKSVILSTVVRLLLPLILLFSLFILLRGHNEPGGGFIGGLAAASGWVLYLFAFGSAEAKRALRLEPLHFIILGLTLALGSGLFSVAAGKSFMQGVWLDAMVPVLGKIGTPVVFDVGVYFVVIGIVLKIVFALAEEEGR
ncbi:MAG: Na+/H+ antiporter subunit B [Bacteroidetes bacterium]|jgi:multicomponent Na+:H+ antiporter subunit B|nr:Na+/H+ antiporter subunit B [Bacteroidota bacterium]